MKLADLIAVARGNKKADIVLKNARIINTFNGEIGRGNIAILGNRIAGIGDYNQAREFINLKGDYVSPGLINGHTHIESSMLHPVYYAQAIVPKGTSVVITDLHEITNVCGFAGFNFVRKWAHKLPVDMFFMVPSCVPATQMETSGAEITANDIKKALKLHNVIGLGEMMNFPGVIHSNKQVLQKISCASGKVIDGHAPHVSSYELNAYLSAGILSDHECTDLHEAVEKLSKGMYIMIREGSSEKNLDELLPLVTDKTYKRCIFVVDDRNCTDLLHQGDIDAVIRKAISRGMNPVRAIQLATINPSEYFRLHNYGGIGPGYMANIISITNLDQLEIDRVFHGGKLVAEGGKLLTILPEIKGELENTVKIKKYNLEDIRLRTNKKIFRVIQIIPGQILTRNVPAVINVKNGYVEADLERDILKLVVIERHKSTGNIGIGLIQGFGLKRGALASSIAHDSHNIIAIGTNDLDIYRAIKAIKETGGGLVICADNKILAKVALPIAGLLSDKPLAEVVNQNKKLERVVSEMGNLPPAPFALLSFMSLPVIPELKLTDRGLVDVVKFKLI